VDKLMGKHIHQQGQEPKVPVSFQGLQDSVILKANEIEIANMRSRVKPIFSFGPLLEKRKESGTTS
jgi:hypothetical protein